MGRADWWEAMLLCVVAVASVVLAIWLLSAKPGTHDRVYCPAGWHERTLPHAVQCVSPSGASVQSGGQPPW